MLIGIVTNWMNADIYEVLKVWAIQKTFVKRGYDVVVVNYEGNNLTGADRKKLHYSIKESEFRKYFTRYEKATNGKELNQILKDAELCIVTDEHLWELREKFSICRNIFLDCCKEKRKIVYDVTSSLDYKLGYLKTLMMKKAFRNMEAVYVSDEKIKSYIEKNFQKECVSICDSSFLLRKKEWYPLMEEQAYIKEYILVDVKEKNEKISSIIQKVKKETGMSIIDVRTAQNVSREMVEQFTPSEYLGAVASAKYVITDHYYGAIYALIYGKPMVYVEGNETSSKTREVLQQLLLSTNIISDSNPYDSIKRFSINMPHNLHKRFGRIKTDTIRVIDKITGMEEDHEEYVDAPTGIKKKDCRACYACNEVCPVDAITMTEDKKGFYYPVVDKDKCINCMLCNKACVINKTCLVEHEETFPKVFAAYNKDLETRKGSSSGAIFPGLAKYIIEEKHGFVAGVCYNENMDVVSEIADNMEDVKKFYGSTYAKSDLEGAFRRVKRLLDEGHYVLYSGLPCECSGLRAFLRKDYDNLFICEIICHATPSTKVLKKYLTYLERKFKDKVTNVIFRQKRDGWLAHKTSMVVEFEKRKPLKFVNRTNNYYRVFANDFIAREACTNCRFTFKNRAGDVTIGDFWGIQDIHPEMFDDQGTSFVMINNPQGLKIWNAIQNNFEVKETTLGNAFKKNHSKPIHYRIEREEFFRRMEKEPIDELLEEFNDLKK